jgi:hypothetical protein
MRFLLDTFSFDRYTRSFKGLSCGLTQGAKFKLHFFIRNYRIHWHYFRSTISSIYNFFILAILVVWFWQRNFSIFKSGTMQKFIESRWYYKKKKMKLKAQLLVPFPLFHFLANAIYRLSQKWRTNGALRCRRDYRKHQKNVKKTHFDLFANLVVFESGT